LPLAEITPRLLDLPARVLGIVCLAKQYDLRSDRIRRILGAVEWQWRVIDRHVCSLIYTNHALPWHVRFSRQLVKYVSLFSLKLIDSVRRDRPPRRISNSLSEITALKSINGHCETLCCLFRNCWQQKVGFLVQLEVETGRQVPEVLSGVRKGN
jgi:hypothetical protein